MSDTKGSGNDPSMDDILASIRKIISEDEARAQTGGAPSAAPQSPETRPASAPTSAPPDDVLLLTDLIDEPKPAPPIGSRPTLVPPPIKADPANAGRLSQVSNTTVAPSVITLPPRPVAAVHPASPPPSTSAAQPAAPVEPPVKQPSDDQSLVEAGTAGLATSAFDRLSQAVQESVPKPTALDPGPNVGPTGRSLEDIVKELLRPMLKEWLDKNLPTMVERFVEREIVRLTRR